MSKDTTDETPIGKPLLFGDATLDVTRLDEAMSMQANWDNSFVPGYSEMRHDNDLLVLEGRKPIPIARAQWIKVGKGDSMNSDLRDLLPFTRLGYRFVTVSDLPRLGWGMPPAAYAAEDGTIRREDVALAFVSAERAAINIAKQREINADFHAKPDMAPGIDEVEDPRSKTGHGTREDVLKELRDST